MRRRDFLKSAAIATAAVPFARGWAAAEPPRRKIAIIGAGLSGLVAAYELKRRGHDVIVLEGRDRPGGRVFTLREPFANGQHAEAGAMFVPSSHDLTIKYARVFNLTLRPIPPRALSQMLYLRGNRIAPDRPRGYAWPVTLSPAERNLTLDDLSDRYVGPALAELGDPRASTWPPPKLRKYDDESFAEMLRQRGASPGAIELLRLNDADLTGDGIESVSALMILRENKFYDTAWQTFTIAGGSDRLPHEFAKSLGTAVNYGCRVYQVNQTAGGVLITYMKNGEAVTTAADVVICAVPVPVMDRIMFVPALPESLREAQRQLGYTSVTRVYAQTADRPWDSAGLGVSAYTDLPSMTLVNSTFDQPGPGGILHSYATGKNARAAAALDEPGRAAAALADMERLFPGLRKNVVRSASKAWDEDEWSRGAFAFFRPGQMFELPRRLAQPVDRIIFAGEHMSDYPGWMQGALESGLRAVAEAVAR